MSDFVIPADILEIVESPDDDRLIRLTDYSPPPRRVYPRPAVQTPRTVPVQIDADLVRRARRIAIRTGGRTADLLHEIIAGGIDDLELEFSR